MDSPADLLTLYPQHLPSEGEGTRMQRRLPFDNPEVRLGSVSRSVLFPSGNYFRLRRYKDEMFLYCKLSLRDVRAVMRTPGPSISLHTAGALTDVISLSPLSEKNKIFTF